MVKTLPSNQAVVMVYCFMGWRFISSIDINLPDKIDS